MLFKFKQSKWYVCPLTVNYLKKMNKIKKWYLLSEVFSRSGVTTCKYAALYHLSYLRGHPLNDMIRDNDILNMLVSYLSSWPKKKRNESDMIYREWFLHSNSDQDHQLNLTKMKHVSDLDPDKSCVCRRRNALNSEENPQELIFVISLEQSVSTGKERFH